MSLLADSPSMKRSAQRSPRSHKISIDIEQKSIQWIKDLGFKNFIKKNSELFKDPLRNGVLLIKIINRLELLPLIEYYMENPKNIQECQINLNFAFENLSKGKLAIPLYLLMSPDNIIKGKHEFIWGIFHHILTGT